MKNPQLFMVVNEETNPWFKAKDVAELLEFTNTRKAIREKHLIIYKNLKGNESFLLHPETNLSMNLHIDEDDKKLLENLRPVSQAGPNLIKI